MVCSGVKAKDGTGVQACSIQLFGERFVVSCILQINSSNQANGVVDAIRPTQRQIST